MRAESVKEQGNPFWMAREKGSYRYYENERYSLWISGILAFRDDGSRTELAFAESLEKGTADFNKIIGWFKIAFFSKKDDRWFFFGDNSGSQYFYVDKEKNTFSDSFLYLRNLNEGQVDLNYEAVVNILKWNRTFLGDTLVKEIEKTDPDKYYVFENGAIREADKKLVMFRDADETIDIDEIMAPVIAKLNRDEICSVCTGGTDSRVVNAVLDHHGIKCQKIITGYPDNPDVKLSEIISEKLGTKLEIICPDTREGDWIHTGFRFLDGCYDAVAAYRHYLKAAFVSEHGYKYEFGGSGGEFYKNGFIRLILRSGHRTVNDERLYHLLLETSISKEKWCGEKLSGAEKSVNIKFAELAKRCMAERTTEQRCNRVGFEILRSASGPIANGYADKCTKIDPLMDRNLVAAVSHKSYKKLRLHMWQRACVMKYCPEIAEVETNMGLSCSTKKFWLLRDAAVQGKYTLSRIVARVRKKLGLKYVSSEQRYWDRDYLEARKMPQWTKAVALCKEAGVLNSSVTDGEIPLNKTGTILQIAMVLDHL